MIRLQRTLNHYFQSHNIFYLCLRFTFQLFIVLSLLSACSSLQEKPPQPLDKRDLLRSLIYVETQLVDSVVLADQATAANTDNSHLLLAFCDLVKRGVVKLDEAPAYCVSHDARIATQQAKQCSARFHSCVSQCVLINNRCLACESRLDSCFEQSDRAQTSSVKSPL